MSQMWGANIDELTQLATRFDQTAQQMSSIRSSIGHALGQTSWNGTDADRFRQEWSSQSMPALTNVANALQQCAQTLRHAAQLQQQASAAGGGYVQTGGGGGSSSERFNPIDILNAVLKGARIPGDVLKDLGTAGGVLKFLMSDAARKLPGIESGLKYLANEFPELRTILPDAAKYLGYAGIAGGVISAGVDGSQWVQDLHQYGFTAVPTLEAGLNTIADVAGTVPGYGTAVSLGIHGAEWLYNLDPQLDQTLHDDFWRGWDTVSTDVKNTAVNAWDTGTTDIKNVATSTWNTGTTDIKNVATGTWNAAAQGWHDLTSWPPHL
jgi:WXG100 family type VII secretion target